MGNTGSRTYYPGMPTKYPCTSGKSVELFNELAISTLPTVSLALNQPARQLGFSPATQAPSVQTSSDFNIFCPPSTIPLTSATQTTETLSLSFHVQPLAQPLAPDQPLGIGHSFDTHNLDLQLSQPSHFSQPFDPSELVPLPRPLRVPASQWPPRPVRVFIAIPHHGGLGLVQLHSDSQSPHPNRPEAAKLFHTSIRRASLRSRA